MKIRILSFIVGTALCFSFSSWVQAGSVTVYPTSDFNVINPSYVGVYPTSPTTRYDKVDEAIADNSTTYISTGTPNQSGVDFGMEDITPPSGTISNVTVFMRVQAIITSGSGKNIWFKPRVNQVDYSAFTTKAGVATGQNNWEDFTWTYTTNPSTGVAWTWDDINAMKVGILWYAKDTKMFGYLTQINATVNYVGPRTTIQGITLQGVTVK